MPRPLSKPPVAVEPGHPAADVSATGVTPPGVVIVAAAASSSAKVAADVQKHVCEARQSKKSLRRDDRTAAARMKQELERTADAEQPALDPVGDEEEQADRKSVV